MLCLTDGALDLSGFLDVDVRLDANHRHDTVVERFDIWHLLRWVGREVLAAQFDIEVECILVVLSIHSDEILRCECRELSEAGLYLTWEHVNATDNHHIVGAT